MSKRFSVVDARGERPIPAVEGDDPAGDATFPNAGLAIVVYQRAYDIVVHATVERFVEIATVEGFLERLAKRAVAMDGTCTGEHGVGQGKMGYLDAEYGAGGVAAMRAIKKAFDPQNIFNPGKIIALG